MAAAVPVDQVQAVVESEQILVVNGHISQADAVRLVRGFASGELGRAPITLLRPTASTAIPSAANLRQVARPMPEDAPVTIATRVMHEV